MHDNLTPLSVLLAPQQKTNSTPLIKKTESDKAISNYLDSLVDFELSSFKPGIVSIPEQMDKIRKQGEAIMTEFLNNCRNGYKAITQMLAPEDLEKISVDEDNLEIFDDIDAFTAALREGNSIYQLLGFSDDTLKVLEQAASRLKEENKFDEARNAFYFLVTIAPNSALFWLQLGTCYEKLNEFPASLECFLQVIDLEPTKAIGYIRCIQIYMKLEDNDNAQQIYEKAIFLINKHNEKDWAKTLLASIEEVKRIIPAR